MVTHTWKKLGVSVVSYETVRDMIHISGLRSDDVLFVLCVPIRDYHTPLTLAHSISAAFLSMDEYLHCTCEVNKPCKKHKLDYNPFSSKDIAV